MQRYWMSWICTSKDHRPLTFPPHEEIRGWWCTGSNADGNATLCAVVDAENKDAAMAAVYRDWPEAEAYVNEFGWRFIEPRFNKWQPSPYRFIRADWMSERLASLREASDD